MNKYERFVPVAREHLHVFIARIASQFTRKMKKINDIVKFIKNLTRKIIIISR